MARVVTVANQKGGTGKSMLTLLLAYCFSNGLKVAICDTDLQGSLLSLGLMVDGINIIKIPENLADLQSQGFDLVLVDTPPYLSSKLPELIAYSDFVLVPTKAGFFDLMAIKSTLGLIENAIKTKSNLKAGIVFNMIKNNSNMASEIRSLTQDFSVPVLKSIISDRVSYTRSVISGGVFQTTDEKAKSEITALADEILTHLGL